MHLFHLKVIPVRAVPVVGKANWPRAERLKKWVPAKSCFTEAEARAWAYDNPKVRR